jgi:hypothetical protein
MENNYLKLSSYYVKFDDDDGGSLVRFYDRMGDEITHIYYSWEKIYAMTSFENILNSNLDPYHKWKIRPMLIKIYKTDIGDTIGFYDKNDNLVYWNKYAGSDNLNDIINTFKNDPLFHLDIKYLKETGNINIKNDLDSTYTTYSKIVYGYWNNWTNYFN